MKNPIPRAVRKPWKRLIPLALVLLAILWAGACGSEATCADDYDCPNSDEICVESSCETFTCAVDTDCIDPKTICEDNRCKLPK
jgi:hypothetical protein